MTTAMMSKAFRRIREAVTMARANLANAKGRLDGVDANHPEPIAIRRMVVAASAALATIPGTDEGTS